MVLIFAGAPALLLSGLLYLFSKQLKKRQSIEEYKSDQLIKQMVNYTFDADGMTQLIKSSNNQYEWDDFFKARENKAMFLLYLSKNKALILPKRFFDSQKQIDTFKHLVSENINKFEMNAD
ncbi:YcxB family protein [Alkalibacterium sp. f15]|uniref:YcxB family protein n=1 Tax=Alkalibacterium sp. f15 TaxID=3414029 RepID=UPI003BF8FE75